MGLACQSREWLLLQAQLGCIRHCDVICLFSITYSYLFTYFCSDFHSNWKNI